MLETYERVPIKFMKYRRDGLYELRIEHHGNISCIMTTKINMLTDISVELEKEFGKHGTPERAKFDEENPMLSTPIRFCLMQGRMQD